MKFPELTCGGNRPHHLEFQLDSIKGNEVATNSITILSKPVLRCDESGQYGDEQFAVVTLTRSEIAEILAFLEDDIAKMKKYCPQDCFE